MRSPQELARGLDELRRAILLALGPIPSTAGDGLLLMAEAATAGPAASGSSPVGDEDQAVSSETFFRALRSMNSFR